MIDMNDHPMLMSSLVPVDGPHFNDSSDDDVDDEEPGAAVVKFRRFARDADDDDHDRQMIICDESRHVAVITRGSEVESVILEQAHALQDMTTLAKGLIVNSRILVEAKGELERNLASSSTENQKLRTDNQRLLASNHHLETCTSLATDEITRLHDVSQSAMVVLTAADVDTMVTGGWQVGNRIHFDMLEMLAEIAAMRQDATMH